MDGSKSYGFLLYSTSAAYASLYLSFAKYILGGTMHYMTDAEALDWICSGFGFDRSKVTILYGINEYKINRHPDSAGL